jgi:phenylacetate-CoA ligase
MATISVWGSERDIGRAASRRNRISGRLRADWIVDGYSLDASTVERFHALLRSRHPAAVYGFTSMLEFVARETLRRQLSPPLGWIAAAWNGGEMLYPEQAELFERAFGVPLLNLYGSREFSAMAYQSAKNGPLTILRPLLFLEVVNERNMPAAPGDSGRLVWTSLICRGTPLLRYECGDLGRYSVNGADESGIRELDQLHGRTAGLLLLANGKTVNNLFWNHLFKDFSEIEQFQIVVSRERGLKLRLKGTGISPGQETRVRDTLRSFIGELPVRMEWVDRIPLTRQGKLEQVVREP